MALVHPHLRIQQLDHIAFYVRNLEISEQFYERVLELPRLSRPPFDFAGAWFALGTQQLHLIVDTMNQDNPRHSLHAAFLVDDAVATGRLLRERGVAVSALSVRPDGMLQVFFNDPDGYRLEFMSQASTEGS